VSVRHHPSEAILGDYASGALRPAFAAVAAVHLQACCQCRAAVAAMERVGGALVGGLPPEPMAPDSLESILARLDEPAPAQPEPDRRAIVDRLSFGRRRWVGPGMWLRHADRDAAGGELLYMLRLPGGLSTFPHGHRGCEHTVVLEGAFSDCVGRFAQGDFAEVDDQLEHQPQVEPGAECICLIASEAPMRVSGWIGRFVHAMTGV
jgi:putative transcriptional regulator